MEVDGCLDARPASKSSMAMMTWAFSQSSLFSRSDSNGLGQHGTGFHEDGLEEKILRGMDACGGGPADQPLLLPFLSTA